VQQYYISEYWLGGWILGYLAYEVGIGLCGHGEEKEVVLRIGVIGNLDMHLGVVVEHRLSVL
jgi:hypothetical protein